MKELEIPLPDKAPLQYENTHMENSKGPISCPATESPAFDMSKHIKLLPPFKKGTHQGLIERTETSTTPATLQPENQGDR